MSGDHYKPVEWFVNLSPAAGSTGSKFGLAVEEAIGLVQTKIKSKVSQEFIGTNDPIKSSWTLNQGCHVSAKCQREPNFLQAREKSGNFEKMSGNFGNLTHARELSGNFVMLCQGIVREFCYDIYF